MQTMAISVFILGTLMVVARATSVTRVPVMFVTEEDVNSDPGDTNYFYLRLCGGCLYDHQQATVYINQPNKQWNPDISDFIILTVFDAHGHQIAVNKVNDNYVPTFNLTYFKSYGDLKLVGNTLDTPGGVTYTITVKFPNRTQTSYCEKRYASTQEELAALKELQTIEAGRTYELVSVFLTSQIGSVKTQQKVYWELDYCFKKELLPVQILISTIATDTISGFATYVCPGHVQKCSTIVAPFKDYSGASVNFVRANLTQVEDVGPVIVIIRGDGRAGQINKYKLAGSKVFH